MKQRFFLVTLLLIMLGVMAFVPYRKAPAGTQAIPGLRNAFMDQAEVTNGQWRAYLGSLAKADSAAYYAALPDLGVWFLAYEAHFSKEQERYEDYPVVGVSYEQAQAYCQWRSKEVSRRENRRISYRLPGLKSYRMCLSDQHRNKVAEGLYSTRLGFRSFLGFCDNAAEMIEDKGQAIRGSKGNDCLETYQFGAPEPALGFRCVAYLE